MNRKAFLPLLFFGKVCKTLIHGTLLCKEKYLPTSGAQVNSQTFKPSLWWVLTKFQTLILLMAFC